MKRPWLISTSGMRLVMVMGMLLSILLIWPAYNQVLDEGRPIPPLDPNSLTYCQLESCGYIKELGLEIIAEPIVSQGNYGTDVLVRVVNKGRMSGTREIWAELRNPEGGLVGAMRGLLTLTDQGPQHIVFFYVGETAQFEDLRITLIY